LANEAEEVARALVRVVLAIPVRRCRWPPRCGVATVLAVAGSHCAVLAVAGSHCELPAGIDRVLVNGTEVVTGGAWNGATAGRVLRRGEPG
jgi:hypothetical protein